MTETQPYSFISVSSSEDDEVIQAGVGAPDKTRENNQLEHVSSTPAVDDVQPQSKSTQAVDTPHATVQPSFSETQQPIRTTASEPGDEQDNEPVPFAHMQKVILVVLAVFVLAFVIYYTLTIR